MARIAEAIGAAHEIGVLHKDVKPSNILVENTATGPVVRVADFGSGDLSSDEHITALGITRQGLTRTDEDPASTASAVLGTPLYMAPELLDGHAPTIKSDLYSLGVMLYQMLVGDFRRPVSPGWEERSNYWTQAPRQNPMMPMTLSTSSKSQRCGLR